jgi:energy-coupling factor transporter ATP-binding protein EcfA2
MNRQLAPLEFEELVTWLAQVSHMIDRDLREPVRSEAVRPLRDERAGTATLGVSVLAQLALLADCLRVAHLAIGADGEIEAEEVARVAELVRVAATKYYTALPAYEMFDERPVSAGDVARFLGVHRDDEGPFGFAHPSEWPGLALARVVERATRNASPLRAHERMLGRIMDVVFQERSTAIERAARRRLRELFEEPAATSTADPRALAFCRSDGPEVFSSIAHGSHVHERDPFDVETIHGEARDVFLVQVERATTPEHVQHGHGRTLLVLGDSGAGKTHLLRALRTLVHERRLGYVGYVQTTTDADDFARYVLRGLIDSLERPYDAPSRLESGLMYLSDGFVQGRAAVPADELDRLRTAELSPDELEHLVGRLVDRIVRSEGLAGLETDLVQVLLLLQRRDPALQRRVVRFLRCEPLNGYDRQLLGGLNARAKSEDPQRTLVQLAKIMHELQLAALVLLVDQVEETIPDGRNVARLQQALDTLRAIADAVPSAVVVISCLEDVYDAARPRLSRALLDRLEHDPPPVRLTSRRQPAEIEEMLIRRLDHLYAAFDVAWRDDDPLFPFTPAQLEAVSRMRTRDCLASFREYHGACIAARAIVAPVVRGASPTTTATTTAAVTPATSPTPSISTAAAPPPAPRPPAIHLDKEWARAQAEIRDLPEAEPEIVGLVASALRGAALELGLELTVRQDAAGRLAMAGRHVKPSLLALVNRGPQGGHLGGQINELRKLAKQAKAVPIALRTSDFSFQPKTKISQQLGELAADGGLAVVLPEQQLRVAAAAHLLEEREPPGLAAWRRESRPLAELPFVREIFEHLRVHAAEEPAPTPEPAATTPAASPQPSPAAAPPRQPAQASTPAPVRILPRKPSGTPAAPAPADSTPSAPASADSTPAAPASAAPAAPAPPDPHAIRLGVVDSMRADPILLPLEQLKTHMAFLGSTGSGKTTAALCVLEQLLERGVSVLLVDRKGDLARYVDDAWWHDPAAPPRDRERKAALRARIDVALYTPGNPQGRPLRLPLVPALDDASPHDREQLARFAAGGLATMMGYGSSAAHKAKASILQCAINLHAAERDVSLDMLLDTIRRPDPELLHTVGTLQRHFAGLTEDLQTLSIQRGSLVSGQGDALDVAQLLPPLGADCPRLSIINTSALTEVPVLQFWISRLLIELGRLGRKRPSPALQAAAFFDEADAYVPATSAPPTKEPMFDLLRRSRSTGIGVLLATQNPGDFDYKARDNITTWLLGKITQDRAIDKMRNLIASYPDVGPRLASQRTGSFFLLTGATKRELKADRSLMETAQLSEAEVAELARATRSPAAAR